MQSGTDTAVILAAGMGTRLGERGQSRPKGFLQLGDRPIVEDSIVRLQHAGVERIIIVTGHLAEFYEALAKRYTGLVETVHNERYANSGSMYSLYQVQDLVNEGFLLLESDLIYEQNALRAVQEFPKDNVVLLSGPTHSGDEVYVEIHDEKLHAMSKDRAQLGETVAGELVGISRISLPLFEYMLMKARDMFASSLQVDYETDCLVAVASEYPVYCQVIRELLWAEIDDEQHLQRALTEIYPRIAHELHTGTV